MKLTFVSILFISCLHSGLALPAVLRVPLHVLDSIPKPSHPDTDITISQGTVVGEPVTNYHFKDNNGISESGAIHHNDLKGKRTGPAPPVDPHDPTKEITAPSWFFSNFIPKSDPTGKGIKISHVAIPELSKVGIKYDIGPESPDNQRGMIVYDPEKAGYYQIHRIVDHLQRTKTYHKISPEGKTSTEVQPLLPPNRPTWCDIFKKCFPRLFTPEAAENDMPLTPLTGV